jgi:hypothetical protein
MTEITDRWTWPDAMKCIEKMNEVIAAAMPRPVYVVYHFAPGLSMIPQEGSALSSIRRMMLVDNANEQLIIMIGSGTFLRVLIEIAAQLSGSHSPIAKYRFIATLDAALAEIQAHKAKSASEQR